MGSVSHVSKFLHVDQVVARHGRDSMDQVEVIGVVPYEYPSTGWMRDDLMPFHINEYMNIMTTAEDAVFLSDSILELKKINVGDDITLFWDDNAISCVVYGYIPYFPTYQPWVLNENDEDGLHFPDGSSCFQYDSI